MCHANPQYTLGQRGIVVFFFECQLIFYLSQHDLGFIDSPSAFSPWKAGIIGSLHYGVLDGLLGDLRSSYTVG